MAGDIWETYDYVPDFAFQFFSHKEIIRLVNDLLYITLAAVIQLNLQTKYLGSINEQLLVVVDKE